MANGRDCKCSAMDYAECACDADWTSQEVYDLREKVAQLTAQVEELQSKLDKNTEKTIQQVVGRLCCKYDDGCRVTNYLYVTDGIITQAPALCSEWIGKRLEDVRKTLPKEHTWTEIDPDGYL